MNHKIIRVLLAIIVVGSLILLYYHFLDGTWINPILTSLNPRTYHTTKDMYNVGDDVLAVGSNFCKLRDVPTTVYWELQDDVSLAYPPKESFFPKGCYGGKLIEIEVLPGFIGNHKYHFTGKVIYHLLARDIIINLSTNDFYVNPGSSKK